jgi:uncharacterized protein YneF (UPF0154 family)
MLLWYQVAVGIGGFLGLAFVAKHKVYTKEEAERLAINKVHIRNMVEQGVELKALK